MHIRLTTNNLAHKTDTFPTDPEAAVLVEGGQNDAAMVDVWTKNKGAREASYFFVPGDSVEIRVGF